MRLWLNVSAFFALTLIMPMAADARGAMIRPTLRLGMAATHDVTGRPIAGTGLAARPIVAGNPEERFRAARQAFGAAAGAYGYLGYYPNGYAGDYGLAGAAESADRSRSALLYRYEHPPQLTCFRPRLITIGIRPVQNVHLPKVVYGAPLSCGLKGT